MTAIDRTRWQAMSPLVDELLDADAATRDARLAVLHRDDPALADDIAALLSGEAAIARAAFLEGSAVELRADVEDALAGKRIGAYMLERPLGQGGMGSVWLARRCDGRFEGKAAVKFLNYALLTRGGPERFEREGNLLARLAHPHIARLLDAGVADGGQPYLVIEYVEGEPIDAWCERHALDVDARIRLFLDVLAAVGHAHGKLILHRDIKPSNILVTAEGQVKLLDFGIAKLLDDDEERGRATALTQLAGRAFTPEYAAPEQVKGADVTTATDVYSLGVLLYRLVSGEHPTAPATRGRVDELRAIAETVPKRLSSIARLRHPRRAIRSDLDNIVAKALKKEPAERYTTVAAFADDLQRYLTNEPVAARPDSAAYRVRKFVQRHRVGVAAASMTLLALVAGIVGTTWQAIEARRERDVARFEAERAVARGNLFNLLLGALRSADAPLTQREVLERSLQAIEKQFGNDPRLAVDLMLPIAGQYMTLGDTERELAVMRRAAEFAARTGDASIVASVACDTVETHTAGSRFDLAEAELATGLRALATVSRPEFKTIAACLQAEAELARARGEFDVAFDRASRAVHLVETAGETRGNIYPKLLSFLSLVERERGNLVSGLEFSKRMQHYYEQSGNTATVAHVVPLREQSSALMTLGEYASARDMMNRIAASWQSLTGDEATPSWVGSTRGRLALRFDDVEGARRMLDEAATRARAQGWLSHAFAMELWLARADVRAAEFARARRLLDAYEVRSRHDPDLTPATVRAELFEASAEPAAAVATIAAEVARLRIAPARERVAFVIALLAAARINLSAGDADTALAMATEALAVAERVARDPARSADVGEALLLQARAQRALDRPREAAALARRAAGSLAAGLSSDHRLTREALALTYE